MTVADYALAVACPGCGATSMNPCLDDAGEIMDTVHARRRRRYRQVSGR